VAAAREEMSFFRAARSRTRIGPGWTAVPGGISGRDRLRPGRAGPGRAGPGRVLPRPDSRSRG
jgi:hypothetical protein